MSGWEEMAAVGQMRSYLDVVEHGMCVCVCMLQWTPSPTSRVCSYYPSESEQRWLGRMLSVQACRKPLHWTNCSDLRVGWGPRAAVDSTRWESQMRELNNRLKLRNSAFNWRLCKGLNLRSAEQSVGKDLPRHVQIFFLSCLGAFPSPQIWTCLVPDTSFFLIGALELRDSCILLHPVTVCHLTHVMAYYML